MKKSDQAARTKGALIEAAIGLFGENGYRATPLKAVAQRAGVTHGVIPFHFGSKIGLLLAVTDTCFERFRIGVFEALEDRERDFGLLDLRAWMAAQRAFQDAQPEVGRLFQMLMYEALGPSPELRPHFRAFYDRMHQLGQAWILVGQGQGSIRADVDPSAAVDAMLCFFTGLRTHSLIDPERIRRSQVEEQFVAFLEHGVVAEGPPK